MVHPAEGNDLELAPVGKIRLTDGLGGAIWLIRRIDEISGAPDGGLAPCARQHLAVGTPGIPVGADGEGVIAGREDGSKRTEHIRLPGPTGQAIGVMADCCFRKHVSRVTECGGTEWQGHRCYGFIFDRLEGIEVGICGQGIQGCLDRSGKGEIAVIRKLPVHKLRKR